MRKTRLAIFAVLLVISCTPRKNLPEQLGESFSSHLKRIDSSAILDSVHIIWNSPMTQRMGRIFDDSVYVREFMRIQAQLARSKQKNERDSVEFYQYEIGVMKKEVDSVTQSIAHSDTTHIFGYLIDCAFYIKKNEKTKIDSTIIFIDSTSTMRFTGFMDSSIRRTLKALR
jgi:hypothetical protein